MAGASEDRGDARAGERLLAWSRRWLSSEDVERVIEPAVADLRHELATAPEAARRRVGARGRRAVLGAIVGALTSERWTLARSTPWWLLAFPLLAVVVGTLALGGSAAASQAAFMGLGVLTFALVATTPKRWIGSTWAWAGVAVLGVTLLAGVSDLGTTRWLALGPLRVQTTLLVLPLVAVGGWRPAAVAAAMLAAAPDAVAGGVLALAVPHPLTIAAGLVALLREPAMTPEVAVPVWAAAAVLAVAVVAWRWRGLPEGRAVIGVLVIGGLGHAIGHVPMPLASYGGSAIIAVCIGFALAVARRGGWTESSALG